VLLEIEPWSPALQAGALTSEPPGKPHLRVNKNHGAYSRSSGCSRLFGAKEMWRS